MARLFSASQRRVAEAIAQLTYANPFTTGRMALEQRALGRRENGSIVWSLRLGEADHSHTVSEINAQAEQLLSAAQKRLANGCDVDEGDALLYRDTAYYCLFYRFRDDLNRLIDARSDEQRDATRAIWKAFRIEYARCFELPQLSQSLAHTPGHLLALALQVRRAFHHVYEFVIGSSLPAARLRAAIWESIFTHDMQRYTRSLYKSLGDVTTLVVGPSGTGKELVARAIGMSKYRPFDEKRCEFRDESDFHAVNLAALSPTLIESELFGHSQGAFTGAETTHEGWLEVCSSTGSVFLDEIGELEATIQVKLLRVLQTRTFQRLGSTQELRFRGKVIAATNRDLATEVARGTFRPDFYYRICSDRIATPSLREQIDDAPEDLYQLVIFLARRLSVEEAGPLADEVVRWIEANLGDNYAWPGNVRELEQCVRSVAIRGTYQPLDHGSPVASADSLPQSWLSEMANCQLSVDQLLIRYCTLAYHRCGTYEAAAAQLGIDRRTVRAKLDELLLDQLQRLSM